MGPELQFTGRPGILHPHVKMQNGRDVTKPWYSMPLKWEQAGVHCRAPWLDVEPPPPPPWPFLSHTICHFHSEAEFRKNKTKTQHFQFISLGCCASDISPLLGNTEWARSSWWFSIFPPVARQVFGHPSIKLVSTTFHNSNSRVKSVLLLFSTYSVSLVLTKWGWPILRSTHTQFLPLHKTENMQHAKNVEIAYAVVS